MSRTINIVVTNLSGQTLYFTAGTSQEGPACTANKTSVTPGQTITVTAHNTSAFNGGNKGTFSLNNSAGMNGNLNYVVFYTHPQTGGASYVQLQNAKTDPAGPPSCSANGVGTYYQVYSGDPINATANVYLGVAVGNTGGYAVPLQANPYNVTNNCQDFANSMFGPNMRSGNLITAAFNQSTVPYAPADFSGGQMGTIVATLLNCWNTGTGTDAPILNFLRGYFAPGGGQPMMQMWVPTFGFQSTTSEGAAIYELGTGPNSVPTGYQLFSFGTYSGSQVAWYQPTVRAFLQLLAGGAHFVAVSATEDFANQNIGYNSRDLYSTFNNSSLPKRGDLVNSHYADVGNTTGVYYLNINSDAAPLNCGLILSLLFGRTVNGVGSGTVGQYNTFMQLEGWQAEGASKTTWHNIDYAAYQKSLWNTATYGACPYSEKRGTTVFLAPAPWTPRIYQTTRMMPYVGAYASGTYPNGAPQDWLNTDVVSVPSNAPTLPASYYS